MQICNKEQHMPNELTVSITSYSLVGDYSAFLGVCFPRATVFMSFLLQ